MMARAESLMEEHPDSALTLLYSIDCKLLQGVPVTEYFDGTDDRYHRMLAHYYMAKIRYYSNNCIDATKEAE